MSAPHPLAGYDRLMEAVFFTPIAELRQARAQAHHDASWSHDGWLARIEQAVSDYIHTHDAKPTALLTGPDVAVALQLLYKSWIRRGPVATCATPHATLAIYVTPAMPAQTMVVTRYPRQEHRCART